MFRAYSKHALANPWMDSSVLYLHIGFKCQSNSFGSFPPFISCTRTAVILSAIRDPQCSWHSKGLTFPCRPQHHQICESPRSFSCHYPLGSRPAPFSPSQEQQNLSLYTDLQMHACKLAPLTLGNLESQSSALTGIFTCRLTCPAALCKMGWSPPCTVT